MKLPSILGAMANFGSPIVRDALRIKQGLDKYSAGMDNYSNEGYPNASDLVQFDLMAEGYTSEEIEKIVEQYHQWNKTI